jgi:hypothetical protein
MLITFINKAVAIGATGLEIEYRDGMEWIYAMQEQVGVGIGSIESRNSKPLFEEMETLKRKKEITVSGQLYRLRFSKYEIFGEWHHRIQWKKKQDRKTK